MFFLLFLLILLCFSLSLSLLPPPFPPSLPRLFLLSYHFATKDIIETICQPVKYKQS